MERKTKVAGSAAMIAIFTLLSKGLGFLREVMIASRFGSGMETDTYFVAMTATVLIVGTLGTALNTTLVPVFSEIGEKEGKEGKLRFLNDIINIVFLISLILIIVGFFASPIIIRLLAKGFTGEQFDLAVRLNRIALPIIVFLGFTHILSGFLHSSQKFEPPAITGIPYNFIFLIYLLFFGKNTNISILMIISVIAASSQFLIQVPAVRHMGYRHNFRPNLGNPYLRKVLYLVFPILIGSAVQQINVIIDKTLASDLLEGSISALTYASRINEMVIAVFVMAITTVIFPMLSDAFARSDNRKIRIILAQGINIILLITVPATVGLILLGKPLVMLFFQRGEFGEMATYMTSGALIFYSIGLVATSLRLMLNKVYYSLQDTKTPMINGAIAVAINLVFNIILVNYMQHNGLALATSISAIISTFLLFYDLSKKTRSLRPKKHLICFVKTLAASGIMGLVVYLIFYQLGGILSSGKLVQILLLLTSVALGALSYFFFCLVFRVKELNFFLKKILDRIS